ncbi:MAG: flavodoxin family protein, partial [Oscillospiraceae bacterium]|nr:flavodoxin family protein [Oscillospiraceae bacterium]
MKILILNGSPRPKGNTAQMAEAFRSGAESAGHEVTLLNVAHMNIKGCLACEYCHTRGNGACIQKDDMQQVYDALRDAEMLVLAAPIYY